MWISRDVAVPLREIALRTSRSSGPGGQHANVTESRVEAVFDVAGSDSLNDAQKARHGMEVEVGNGDWADGSDVRMFDEQDTLIAVGRYDENRRRLHPRVVIDTA